MQLRRTAVHVLVVATVVGSSLVGITAFAVVPGRGRQ